MRRGELADLTAFIAVADNLSFRTAATRLGVTLSAFSHTVRATVPTSGRGRPRLQGVRKVQETVLRCLAGHREVLDEHHQAGVRDQDQAEVARRDTDPLQQRALRRWQHRHRASAPGDLVHRIQGPGAAPVVKPL
jgi:hypothetical protein